MKAACVFIALSLLMDASAKTPREQLTVPLPSLPSNAVLVQDGMAEFPPPWPTFGQYGEPELPVDYLTLLLPAQADLKTVMVSLEKPTLTPAGLAAVRPVPPKRTGLGREEESPLPMDKMGRAKTIYGRDAFFPASCIRSAVPGRLRDYKLLDVAVQRFQYNPANQGLRQLQSGELKVSFELEPSVSPYPPDPSSAALVKEMTCNYDNVCGTYGQVRSEKARGYCIMTTDELVASSKQLQKFIQVRKNEGLEVKLCTQSTWGGGSGAAAAANIRNWLKSNYQAQNIAYVLLIGDPNSSSPVPMVEGPTKSKAAPLTDYCYADLSSNVSIENECRFFEYALEGLSQNRFDKYAEVHVGRIPVYNNNVADLDYILAKLIRYVTEPQDKAASWRERVLMPLHTFGDAQNGWVFGEFVKTNLLTAANWKWFRIYDDHMGMNVEAYPNSYANTKKHWNEQKAGIMVWQGHGAVTFTQSVLDLATAKELKDDYPSHGFQISCFNGQPKDPKNLGYALLRHGAVSTIASALEIWYSQNTTNYGKGGSGNDFAYVYLKHLTTSKLPAAEAFDKGRAELPINGSSDWQNLVELNLYGCPAIGVYTWGVPETK